MTAEGLSAWLLHTRKAKGSSVEAFFFTRTQGLVRAYCNSGRGRYMRGVLQPFTPLWLTLQTKHYGTYTDKVEMTGPAKLLMGQQMIAGIYLNEVLYRLLKPEAAEARLYDVYEFTIESLIKTHDNLSLQRLLRRFEFKLIDYLGYGVSYTHEAMSHEPISVENEYVFRPNDGFYLYDKVKASEFALNGADILAIAQGELNTKPVLKTAKYIMRLTIDALLDGAEIKTRALYLKQ